MLLVSLTEFILYICFSLLIGSLILYIVHRSIPIERLALIDID